MPRALVFAVVLSFLAVPVGGAEFQAILMKVDVKRRQLEVIKIPPPPSKDGAHSNRVQTLKEGEIIMLKVADKVRVFTQKEKSISGKVRELQENPAGLNALKSMVPITRSSPTIHYADLSTDDKTGAVVSIRMTGTFWIDGYKK